MNFDLNNTPLEKAVSLIEASAGTGKTYTIAGLFLRLLLEEGLGVQEILVVTYTNAATEELRSRVREILNQAEKAFSTNGSKNPFLQTFFVKHESSKTEMLKRIDRALSSFDEAPIYSIHGFCQRMLKDRAFESGVLFDIELAADVSGLLQEIADDYWRRTFYNGNSIQTGFALKNGFSPASLLPWVKSCLNYPFIKFLSAVDGRSLPELTAELEVKFEKLKSLWGAEKLVIQQLFGSHQKKAWANSPYNDDDKVREFFLHLEKCFSAGATVADMECLTLFCNGSLVAKTGKNKTPPRHAFFDACDDLCRSETLFVTVLQMDFLRFALDELPRRKDKLKVHSFDDLLTRLQSALRSSGGNNLGRQIASRYRAALIDEFQDTDPVQYEIFRSIFFSQEHYLFLIGDPKQAIYGFRGADIFTYMKAASEAARKFTLSQNWRSESGLVAAINSIFSQSTAPFVFSKIEFKPVEAKGEVNKTPLRIDGQISAPFELWFSRRDNDRPIAKEAAEKELPAAVAAEISRLLNSNVTIGDRRVRPEDIAVLVLENRQAQLMQDALNALGIPAVQQTTASLFESEEADELHRILLAISQPTNERLVKAALATNILGMTANELAGFSGESSEGQTSLESFHDYFEQWTQRGFIQMFREFLRREKVRPRLLGFADGERRLTNVLHLGEVLHGAVIEQRLGVTGLIRWLVHQRSETEMGNEEYQLRLERDENAVKLATVHRSKGLEYGIVFCPFSWKHSELMRGGEDQVFFHDRETGDLIRDLGSANYDEHRRLALEEKVAENLRLLYVALTRAKHRCYFVWGHFNKAESSAPAWLFHGSVAQGFQDKAARFKGLNDEAMLEDLQRLQPSDRQQPATIHVRDVPKETGLPYRPTALIEREPRCPTLTTVIRNDWRITSFSSLQRMTLDEGPDYDGPEKAPAAIRDAGIFAFPSGTKPGICLHEIFEEWNFSQTNTDLLKDLVTRKLLEHGLSDAHYVTPICEMVRNVLSVSLDGENPEFQLSKLARVDRLSEMEFYFPLKKMSPLTLRNIFTKHQVAASATEFPAQIGRLAFNPFAGYVKGYIDLVFRFAGKFYIIDWKSNWLGNSTEHYTPKAMFSEMVANNYFLQSHLYTLAVHQYLSGRVADYNYARDFGGVFYIFLRGVDSGRPQFGVFRDYPSEPLVSEMVQTLIRQ
ncbi:MAG: recB [Verrucomicrobiales bacterium]|nr:recB [Verrucomicrobiales bacterium]